MAAADFKLTLSDSQAEGLEIGDNIEAEINSNKIELRVKSMEFELLQREPYEQNVHIKCETEEAYQRKEEVMKGGRI